MAYCTKQQVRDATGMQNTTKITDAYLDLKIGYADGLINGKIGEVYVLPLSVTPALIAYYSLEITVAVLFMDQYGENSGDSDKGWEKRLNFLLDLLEDIRNGKIKLFNDTTGVELARTTLKSPTHYPTDASSAADAVDSTAPKTTMNQTW